MSQQREISELKVASIITYINLLISTIIPLCYTPIMLRILGQAEYGLYSLSNSIIGYLSLLNLGLGSAIVRYTVKARVEGNHKKVESIVGLFVFVYTILAIVVVVAGVILSKNAGVFFGNGLSEFEIKRLKILMVIMTCSTAISFPQSVYACITTVYERYIFRRVIECIGTILAPILNLVVLFLGMASIGMAFIGLIVQIIYTVIFVLYCKRKLNVTPDFHNMPFFMLKEIGSFTAFVFLSTIVDMLYWATDKVLIGATVGTLAVAIYNIGGTFTGMLQNMSAAISNVFTTRVNMMVMKNESSENISDLLIRIGRLQYLVVSLILSGYIVFGRTFIHFWAGDNYAQAYSIGLLTMIPLAVPLIQSIAYSTIVAQNKHRFRAIVYSVIAVINVVSTYLCLPRFGIVGAAVCTSVAFAVGNGVIMNIYYYKVIGLNIPLFWKNIIKMSVVPAVLVCAGCVLQVSCFQITNIFIFLISVIVFVIAFVVMTWIFSMNDYERKLFGDIISKVIPKKKKL